jgi:hypothetical protein
MRSEAVFVERKRRQLWSHRLDPQANRSGGSCISGTMMLARVRGLTARYGFILFPRSPDEAHAQPE